MDVMKKTVAKFGDKPALCMKREADKPWRTWTYKDYLADVNACAKSLLKSEVLLTCPPHT